MILPDYETPKEDCMIVRGLSTDDYIYLDTWKDGRLIKIEETTYKEFIKNVLNDINKA